MRLAQLDRASDYGSEGREFESSIARYRDCKEISLQSFYIFGNLTSKDPLRTRAQQLAQNQAKAVPDSSSL